MVNISLCGVKWCSNETLDWMWSSIHGASGVWQWQGTMAKVWDFNVKMKIEKQGCDGINFMMVYPRYSRVI
jgi:hypothetical protein